MRQVAQIMGMPISLDMPGSSDGSLFELVFAELRQVDERFSPFKYSSELSAYNRGELKQADLSPQIKAVIKACRQAEQQTNGYFSAWYKSNFEPSGYVKGWAIKQAAQLLSKHGVRTFCLSAGGDILARSDGIKTWRLGIQNPFDERGLADVVSEQNIALATSGSYERGQHIINPKSGQPAEEFISLSVLGPDIVQADVLATAGFAQGSASLKTIEQHNGYEALAILPDGRQLRTTGWPSRNLENNR